MKLIDVIRQEALKEYRRSCEEFGRVNHSSHESYAIILEEFEEATQEGVNFQGELEIFWELTKGCEFWRGRDDVTKIGTLKEAQEHAEKAAAQWVQVAAMCHKAILTEENTNELD